MCKDFPYPDFPRGRSQARFFKGMYYRLKPFDQKWTTALSNTAFHPLDGLTEYVMHELFWKTDGNVEQVSDEMIDQAYASFIAFRGQFSRDV